MIPFKLYPGSLAGNTLSYHRFGERAGSLVDVVGGKTLTNVGAEALDDGYKLVHTESDYLTCTFTSIRPTAGTLEAWVRAVTGPVDALAVLLRLQNTASSYVAVLRSFRSATPANSYIEGFVYQNGPSYSAKWIGVDAHAILISPSPWHAATDWNNGTPCTLCVNGVVRAASGNLATNFLNENYLLHIGANPALTQCLSAIIDEVRVSNVRRYAGVNFPITRFGEGRRLGLRGPGILATAGGIP